MSRFLNILAAVSSVSVFGVLVWWGLTLSQLDPNDIPVIKKANGPARVSPEEPGGKQADHQGLSVSEVQAANGISKLVDKVYLAPKPRPLQAEDIAGLDTQKKPATNMKFGQAPILKDKSLNSIIDPILEQNDTKSDLVDLKKRLKKNNEIVPQIRPKNLELNLNNSIMTDAMAQLGGFDEDVVATIQLENLKKIHSDLFLSKDLFIDEVNNGAEIKYILKVKNFIDINDVESFCMALKKAQHLLCPINCKIMISNSIIFGCEGTCLTKEERFFFKDANPWAFILFSRNLDSPNQIKTLCNDLRDCVGSNVPILIDQEGGRVARLKAPIWLDWLPPLDSNAQG